MDPSSDHCGYVMFRREAIIVVALAIAVIVAGVFLAFFGPVS